MKKWKRSTIFTAVFAICITVSAAVTATYIHNKSNMELAQMEQLLLVNTNKVNMVITKLLYKTQVLSALVIQNNGAVTNFDQVASTILDDPAIRNVNVAPDGIVSHVYPLEGNEEVIGFDYFSDSAGNQEADTAMESGQLVLGGPFDLVQGGQALVGRLPVYLEDEATKEQYFWGLVSVTLNYPDALDGAELARLEEQSFAYEIWRISPDTGQQQMIAASSYQYNKGARYVEREMVIQNAVWYFRLSPICVWYEYPETWVFTLAGLLISLLIASLVVHNRDLTLMKKELESLTCIDTLTGLPNRRGLFQELAVLTEEASSTFLLCYIDIDKFKDINDSCGHYAGDRILEYFADTFRSHMKKDHFLARIGGDEFILLMKGVTRTEDAEDFLQSIHEAFHKYESEKTDGVFEMHFSAGFAVYPDDARDMDDLITIADHAMYENKKNYQS